MKTSGMKTSGMKTFEISINFGDYSEKYLRECENRADALYEAKEIIETLYTKNGHLITGYEVEELKD